MNKTIKIYEKLYKDYEKNKPLGIDYPTEALVIFVSNLRKNKKNYFADYNNEKSIKKNFKGKALEIGFGSIANLKMLQEKGFECFGSEVSLEAIRRAKKFSKNIKFKTMKNSKLNYPKNEFDLIVGLQCVYYNLDFRKFIEEEVFKILKPSGKFIFSFFAKEHSYQNYIEKNSEGISQFSKKHPNKRLIGAKLYAPKKKKELLDNFKIFKNVKLFTSQSDQTVFNEAWWYVVGEK